MAISIVLSIKIRYRNFIMKKSIHSPEIRGESVIKHVRAQNEKGKYSIFALNQVNTDPRLSHTQIESFHQILQNHQLDSSFFDYQSKLARRIVQITRNRALEQVEAKFDIPKHLESNITIFPYQTAYASGEQDFFNDQGYQEIDSEFLDFIALQRSILIPVYMEYFEEDWRAHFAIEINPRLTRDEIRYRLHSYFYLCKLAYRHELPSSRADQELVKTDTVH